MQWICHKCSFPFEVNNPHEVAFCPHCGARASDEDVVSPDEPKKDMQTENLNPLEKNNSTCPICCCEISSEDEQISCPDCGTLYHKECWDENKGCATYGCKSAQCLDVHMQNDPSIQNLVPCPWCNTLLSPKTVICSSCGKRTDEQPSVLKKLYWEEIKNIILIPISDRLTLLWKDCGMVWGKTTPYIAYALKSYKRSICKYKQFDGQENRLEFFCFVLISILIYLLLIFLPGNCYLAFLYMFATLLPTIAIMTRRLHDIGLSAWFLFAIPVLPLLLWVPSTKIK